MEGVPNSKPSDQQHLLLHQSYEQSSAHPHWSRMAGVEYNELSFTNSRDQKLFAIEVLPPPGSAKCVCVWAHGFFEHSRRKLKVLKEWAAAGIAVFAYDAHGMGESEPRSSSKRHLVQNMAHLVDDMADFAAHCGSKHAALEKLPWFAGGYSIGGLTAALAVMRWQEQWAGLVLFAPAVGVHMSFLTHVQKFLAPVLDLTVPHAKICQPVAAKALNPDPEAVAEYKADPLCASGRTRIRTAFQLSKGMDALELMAPRLNVPVYCEHCKGDAVARWEVSREFCASVGTEDVTWLAQEGGCHDILSSAQASEAAERAAKWMLQKAAQKQRGGRAGGNSTKPENS